jgi:hypothetical protein
VALVSLAAEPYRSARFAPLVRLVKQATELNPLRRIDSLARLLRAFEVLPKELVASDHEVAEEIRRVAGALFQRACVDDAGFMPSGVVAQAAPLQQAHHWSTESLRQQEVPTVKERNLVTSVRPDSVMPLSGPVSMGCQSFDDERPTMRQCPTAVRVTALSRK